MPTDTATSASPKPLTPAELARARVVHLAAVAEDRRQRWLAHLALVRSQLASFVPSARILASVQRKHQKRGVPQAHPHLPSPGPLKRGKQQHPLWSYTPTRVVIPLRRHTVIGRVPQPKRRAA